MVPPRCSCMIKCTRRRTWLAYLMPTMVYMIIFSPHTHTLHPPSSPCPLFNLRISSYDGARARSGTLAWKRQMRHAHDNAKMQQSDGVQRRQQSCCECTSMFFAWYNGARVQEEVNLTCARDSEHTHHNANTHQSTNRCSVKESAQQSDGAQRRK